MRTHVCRAVASVFQLEAGCGDDGSGDGDENAEEPPDDETFEPDKCKIHETGDEYSQVIRIGFIEFGENAGFVVTEYSDGSVTMMATNGAEIGATGGFGADAAWGELEAGAKVDFGAGVEFDYGSTWHFEDEDQATSFREQLDDYLYDQWAMTHPVCTPMGMCMPRPHEGDRPAPGAHDDLRRGQALGRRQQRAGHHPHLRPRAHPGVADPAGDRGRDRRQLEAGR